VKSVIVGGEGNLHARLRSGFWRLGVQWKRDTTGRAVRKLAQPIVREYYKDSPEEYFLQRLREDS